MRETEEVLKCQAAARLKYSSSMGGVITQLIGIQRDIERDMYELEKEYYNTVRALSGNRVRGSFVSECGELAWFEEES